MSAKQDIITLRVRKDEKDQIEAQAHKANLSVSQFVRAVILEAKVPGSCNADAVKALYKCNADMSRLGNMLKGFIDSGEYENIDDLVDKINESRAEIKLIALEMSGKKKKT